MPIANSQQLSDSDSDDFIYCHKCKLVIGDSMITVGKSSSVRCYHKLCSSKRVHSHTQDKVTDNSWSVGFLHGIIASVMVVIVASVFGKAKPEEKLSSYTWLV